MTLRSSFFPYVLLALAAGGAALAVRAALARGARPGTSAAAPREPEPRAQTYYCPMHPSYRSDHPGECPICNMKLVLLQDDPDAHAAHLPAGRGIVTLRPEQRQLVGVRTAPAERSSVRKTIRAAARVELDERRLSAVDLKVGGWIEELFVRSVGETVTKGQALFTLWSPELYEAQQNYALLARAHGARGDDAGLDESLRAARERLLLWDLTEEQLARLEGGEEPERLTTLHARFAGVVLRRDVVAGTYAEAGRDLFQLADLGRVWIQADVQEHEIGGLRAGLAAEVEVFSRPGERFAGEIAHLYPTLDEATRTQRVRLEMDNGDGRLEPGMFGVVSIPIELGEGLVIDDSAVLDTGTRRLVFVETAEGRFEPREVELGERGEGRVVVTGGLAPGDVVATSGTFLLDSESRLRAAVLGRSGGEPAAAPEHRH